jgi:prophage regulatory protein
VGAPQGLNQDRRNGASSDVTLDDLIREPRLAELVPTQEAPRMLAAIAAAQVALVSAQSSLLAKLLQPTTVAAPPPVALPEPVAPAPIEAPRPSEAHQRGRYMRAGELVERLGVCRATLWKWRQRGWFPEPVSLGPNVTAWPIEVVEAWETKAAQRSPRMLEEQSA